MSYSTIGVKSPTGLERMESFSKVSDASFLDGVHTGGNFQTCLPVYQSNDCQVFVGFWPIPCENSVAIYRGTVWSFWR